MALQFADTTRNGMLDAIETDLGASALLKIATGAQPANCAAADSGTELIVISLPADSWAAASGGTKDKAGTWSGTATGGAGATPGHFRFKTSGAVVKMQGSAGIGSGDLSFNGTITSGQTITITAATLTGGGA